MELRSSWSFLNYSVINSVVLFVIIYKSIQIRSGTMRRYFILIGSLFSARHRGSFTGCVDFTAVVAVERYRCSRLRRVYWLHLRRELRFLREPWPAVRASVSTIEPAGTTNVRQLPAKARLGASWAILKVAVLGFSPQQIDKSSRRLLPPHAGAHSSPSRRQQPSESSRWCLQEQHSVDVPVPATEQPPVPKLGHVRTSNPASVPQALRK